MAVPEKKVWRLYTYECIISRMKNMSSAVFLGLWLLLAAGAGWAQDAEVESKILPPREERFVPSDGLMFPERARSLTCGVTSLAWQPAVQVTQADCPPDYRRDELHFLEIQDSNGELWYRFSVYQPDPAYFIDVPTREFVKADFRPLGPGIWFASDYSAPTTRLDKSRIISFPTFVVLRLIAESPNWYEVVANEDTGSKKYISKQDPFWARVGWQDVFSIGYGAWIVIDSKRTDILDKPNGNPISPPCGKTEYLRLFFSSLDGEWMEVNRGRTDCHGWIRWRNGREILVGSHLNGYEVVEPKDLEQ